MHLTQEEEIYNTYILTDLKRETDNQITAGISTPLSTVDRPASEKAGKETLHWNYALDQMHLRESR